MDNGLIPYRYAKALYKYALEHGKTEDVYGISKLVIESFAQDPAMNKVLANPFVKNSDKEKILLTSAGNGPDEAYSRFVRLILEHHREEFALRMMYAYRDIYRKENHISQAQVTTASALPDEQMEKLRKLVASSFKGEKLEFSEKVDPELIGGFIIDVDSVRMDASISNELEQLRQTLLRSN